MITTEITCPKCDYAEVAEIEPRYKGVMTHSDGRLYIDISPEVSNRGDLEDRFKAHFAEAH